jgi:hypothetical protein
VTQIVPVLVNEDTLYARSPYPYGLFWRTAAPVVALPAFILQSPRPPPWLFEDRFVSVYGVLEAYQQASQGGAQIPVLSLFVPSYRPPEIEPDYLRTNQQLLFQIVRPYVLQIYNSGFVVDVPDFNDNPWLEWVHPPASPESAIYPFRQIPKTIRGQQFNLFFAQPISPRLDPAPDTVRLFDAGIMLWRQAKAGAQAYTTCGHLDVYDYGNGSVLLAWGPFGLTYPGQFPPDSYNIYVNGVFNQNVPTPLIRLAVISGLFGASYNGVTVTPATTYRIAVTAVSAGVDVAISDTIETALPTSVALVTSMKRIYPFPGTGLN